MLRPLVALLLAALCSVLFTVGLNAQPALPDWPGVPDLPDLPRRTQVTVPPFTHPGGATITVTTTVDNLETGGDCSLREAVQAANSDAPVDACPAGDGVDLILLAEGVYRLSLEGSREDDSATGDLDLDSSVVISGIGAAGTIVDANQIDRIFHVHPVAAVELRGLTLRNGRAANGTRPGCDEGGTAVCPGEPGGGIANYGSLVLADVIVMGNRAGDGADHEDGAGAGGAIFNSGSLMIARSQVLRNTSGAGGECSPGGDGGGIFNAGWLTMTTSTVGENGTGEGGHCGRGQASGGRGGGLANQGDLTVVASHVDGNVTAYGGKGGGLSNEKDMWILTSTIGGNREGGGIFNAGRLTIANSTVYSNTSRGAGGGIHNQVALSMINSTVSGNRSGDGIWSGVIPGFNEMPGRPGGGIFNSRWLYVESSTIAANKTGVGACTHAWGHDIDVCGRGGWGGGLANEDGYVLVRNTIIAQNTTGKGGSDPEYGGSFTDRGYNLIGHSSPSRSAWLAPLADNGGPTPTHALLPCSAAINAGVCTTLVGNPLAEDQRGEPRPQGAGCDVGAFESEATTVAATATQYLPFVGDALYFDETVVCVSGYATSLASVVIVDGIAQEYGMHLDKVYSDAPDGPVLGELSTSLDLWVDQSILQADGPLAGDWYVWIVDGEDRRISEIAHVQTDGELGDGTCQAATIIFQSRH